MVEAEVNLHFLVSFSCQLRDAINKAEIAECRLFAVALIGDIYNNDGITIPFKDFLPILDYVVHGPAKTKKKRQCLNLSLASLLPCILGAYTRIPILDNSSVALEAMLPTFKVLPKLHPYFRARASRV